MEDLLDFSGVTGRALLTALATFAIGWVLSRVARRALGLIPDDALSTNTRFVLGRIIALSILGVFAALAMTQLGFDLTILLGAAGIVSVALGFASQTSASNLISGLFLIGERAFSVGDTIKVDGITGEVVSIDLLSVKLRTFDNLFVRIPNENLMKSTVTSLSRFPIRRYDLQVGVAYHENLKNVRDVLLQVAQDFHLCLDEPAPMIIMQGFGESSIDIQFSVWAARTQYLNVRNGLYERVKEAFDREGIEIPFPHRTIYAGSQTDPMPLRIDDQHAD